MKAMRKNKLNELLEKADELLSEAKRNPTENKDQRKERLDNINQQVAIVRLLQSEDRLSKAVLIGILSLIGVIVTIASTAVLKAIM